MKKTSAQTKSFIVLFVITIVGSYVCFFAFKVLEAGPKDRFYLLKEKQNNGINVIRYFPQPQIQKQPLIDSQTIIPQVNTATWKTYTDKVYGFSFKYDPAWKILPGKTDGNFYVIELNPGKKYFHIKISISDKSFFAMDGLPTKEEIINGNTAENVNDLLYGIKNGNYYYTFDVGQSLSLKPQFNALVHSVTFNTKKTAQ